MNTRQSTFFQQLREQHLGYVQTLKAPSMKGILDVISNLYRDDAHFIYELLQNADDQEATHVRFILDEEGLIFIHNAPRHFTISNPSTHEHDRQLGKLGDINSLLSIASSSKFGRTNEFPIGKFGLGFKSVFQYTDRPQIYDDDFRFAIVDYIVPELLGADHPMRRKGETLFYFPFKSSKLRSGYEEIAYKLTHLVDPLLFLNHLRGIHWKIGEEEGGYRLIEAGPFGSGEQLLYEVRSGEGVETQHLVRFSRQIPHRESLQIEAVFELDEEQQLIKTDRTFPLYCFLPTATHSPFPVRMHAPFRLTGNRESIKANDEHNLLMIKMLGDLLTDALSEVCGEGERRGHAWIDDNLLSFLPDIGRQAILTSDEIDLTPMVDAVKQKIKTDRLLWCPELKRYLTNAEACIPEAEYLPEIYPSAALSRLRKTFSGWVLSSLDMKMSANKELAKELETDYYRAENLLRLVNPDFLSGQSEAWLIRWYLSLNEVKYLWRANEERAFLRYQPVIQTSSGEFVPPYTRGNAEPNVHFATESFPLENPDGILFVNPSLLKDPDVCTFFRELGIKEVDGLTHVELILLPQIADVHLDLKKRLDLLAELSVQWMKLGKEEKNTLRNKISEMEILPGVNSDKSICFVSGQKIRLHNPDNDFFYKDNPAFVFFDKEAVREIVGQPAAGQISDLVAEWAASLEIKETRTPVSPQDTAFIPPGAQRPAWYNCYKMGYEYFKDWTIDGIEHFMADTAPACPLAASRLLVKLFSGHPLKAAYCALWRDRWYESPIEPRVFGLLKAASWIDSASVELRRMLGLSGQLSENDLDKIADYLLHAGIRTSEDVSSLIQYLDGQMILESYQRKQDIAEQKAIVERDVPFSLQWLDDILELRLRYVAANEKEDVVGLITSLKDALAQIEGDKSEDLRRLLPDGLNIIFGPPGTGKTTRIVKIVADALFENPTARILILTPTHQAANVVARRLQEADIEAVRGASVFRADKVDEDLMLFDARSEELPPVLVSTVHYYSSTYLAKADAWLRDVPWDEVIVDEASMVTLDYMLLAVFRTFQLNEQCKFYVVGDPLQLPAITNLDPFILEEANLDEFNFFSFIGLKEFSETPAGMEPWIRRKLNITLLKEQYRSVPALCELTGKFAYEGKIVSRRKAPAVNIPDDVLGIFSRPVSFVRFSIVEKSESQDYASIKELDKLRGSNFNIYSALLVKEMLQHLFDRLAEDAVLKIGIITPYVAQKKLLHELLNTRSVRYPAGVSVAVNTVHQFQGDEFDIVLLVLNPPNKTMTPPNGILINRFYLVNVAVSRAKDCLIVLYPDADSCNVQNFLYVNRTNTDHVNIETLATEITGKDLSELTITSSEIEERLFGHSHFLEENCLVQYHHEINYHEHDQRFRYKFVKGGDIIDIMV